MSVVGCPLGVTAQVAVRWIAKVTDACKQDKKTKQAFTPHGSLACDARILSWRLDNSAISIWMVEGRQKIAFVRHDRAKELLAGECGESVRWTHLSR